MDKFIKCQKWYLKHGVRSKYPYASSEQFEFVEYVLVAPLYVPAILRGGILRQMPGIYSQSDKNRGGRT